MTLKTIIAQFFLKPFFFSHFLQNTAFVILYKRIITIIYRKSQNPLIDFTVQLLAVTCVHVRISDGDIVADQLLFGLVMNKEKSDLADWHKANGPLTDLTVCTVFRQMVGCVQHLHQRKIAHRDVKLENFLLVSKIY